MNRGMTITTDGDVLLVLDDSNSDRLVARRLEVFFSPRSDGQPSMDGKIIWHTEWEHYSGSLLRSTSLGPRIERTIEQILAGEFGGILGPAIIHAVKSAFVAHASEDMGIGAPSTEPPAP